MRLRGHHEMAVGNSGGCEKPIGTREGGAGSQLYVMEAAVPSQPLVCLCSIQ